MFKVPEDEKETAADCISKVCAIFGDKLGIPTKAGDIEVGHRTRQRSSTRPRPTVLRSEEKRQYHQQSTQPKDLTYANYQVSEKANEHFETMSVWSSKGIFFFAKAKNGRIVRVNTHTDVDEAFRRALAANELSADEEE